MWRRPLPPTPPIHLYLNSWLMRLIYVIHTDANKHRHTGQVIWIHWSRVFMAFPSLFVILAWVNCQLILHQYFPWQTPQWYLFCRWNFTHFDVSRFQLQAYNSLAGMLRDIPLANQISLLASAQHICERWSISHSQMLVRLYPLTQLSVCKNSYFILVSG